MPPKQDRIGLIMAPSPRFWGALIALPGFLFMDGLVPRAILMLFFIILALIAGKKILWGYFLLLASTITFFHLLVPKGRVLTVIGPFVITVQSLEIGLNRSVTLIGMVMLSVAAIRPELHLPGHLGGLLGRMFWYFERILENRKSWKKNSEPSETLGRSHDPPKGSKRFRWDSFYALLDTWLLEHFSPDGLHGQPSAVISEQTGMTRGWIWAVIFDLGVWGLWGWMYFWGGNG